MDEFEIDTTGAPVVFSSAPEVPYNPLRHPEISFRKPIIALLFYLISSIIIVLLLKHYLDYKYMALCIFCWTFIYFSVIAKRTAIWFVHLYQKYAPDRIRLKCVFTPSCSEYMIAAIEKYGLIKGVIKGVDRLFRCHYPNGGTDLP